MDRRWRNSTDKSFEVATTKIVSAVISVLDIHDDLGTGGLRPHINRIGVRDDDIRALRLGSAISCSVRPFQPSCTSGRAGGLICEPLKAVWPAYAGIVTRIFLVDRASYLLSLVPVCTLESALHPAPPLTRNSPSPKSSAPQSSSPDP